MKKFLGLVGFVILVLFYTSDVFAVCTYSCGVCYQGMKNCTGNTDCSAYPPHPCVVCPDQWRTCDDVPISNCPPGTYACNSNSFPGSCCDIVVKPTDGGPPIIVPTSVLVGSPACTGVGPVGNPSLDSTQSTYDIYAYGVYGSSTVGFWVWSAIGASGGQDDVHWYDATMQADGTTWKATIDFANHRISSPDYGQFYAHSYLNNSPAFCGAVTFVRADPVCIETVSCVPACGQVRTCGVDCPSTEVGYPLAPTAVTMNGTVANPTIISTSTPQLVWNGVSLSDGYDVELYNGNTGAFEWGQSTAGVSATTSNLTPGLKLWRIRASNTTCGVQTGSWSGWYYFRINSDPILIVDDFVTVTSVGETVPWDIGVTGVTTSYNGQICNVTFQDDVNPSRAIYEITVQDSDGWQDIALVQMKWNSRIYNMTLNPGSGLSRTARVTIDYTPADFTTTAMPIEFNIKDALSLGSPAVWVPSNYNFKVSVVAIL